MTEEKKVRSIEHLISGCLFLYHTNVLSPSLPVAPSGSRDWIVRALYLYFLCHMNHYTLVRVMPSHTPWLQSRVRGNIRWSKVSIRKPCWVSDFDTFQMLIFRCRQMKPKKIFTFTQGGKGGRCVSIWTVKRSFVSVIRMIVARSSTRSSLTCFFYIRNFVAFRWSTGNISLFCNLWLHLILSLCGNEEVVESVL